MFRQWLRHLSAPFRPDSGPAPRQTRLGVHRLEDRHNPSTAYLATNLVSDLPGVAPVTDPTLVNAWGISLSPTSGAFWVSANGKDLSELYGGDVAGSPISQPFKVAVPNGAPTGQVFNGTTDFAVTDGTNTKPALFIFASEAGDVTGWNPGVGVAAGATGPSKTAEIAFQSTDGAVYKGIAMANNGTANFLYLTDFHNGKIDVLDSQFHLTHLAGSFTDPNLPKGYAPFNIAAINGKLYVSYAKQDDVKHDDVAGAGHGFIDVFDTNGHFQGRLLSGGDLNSPWGMVMAPAGFGEFGGDLLVGNFGDGMIHAFSLTGKTAGKDLGTLSESPGHPLVIHGLWGLAFGNGKSAGDANSLYFAAGPDHESHGLFGKITANPAGTNPVSATLTGGNLVITGSRDNDRIEVAPTADGKQLVVTSDGQKIGQFATASVGAIVFNGFAGNDVFTVDPKITTPVLANGGAGNDTITGGSGKDILIAGNGTSVLDGSHGQDILIGGALTPNLDQQTLLQILKIWNSNVPFVGRVANLRTGANNGPKLDGTSVINNGVQDVLIGGPGEEWFLGALPDVLHGWRPGEPIN